VGDPRQNPGQLAPREHEEQRAAHQRERQVGTPELQLTEGTPTRRSPVARHPPEADKRLADSLTAPGEGKNDGKPERRGRAPDDGATPPVVYVDRVDERGGAEPQGEEG